MVYAQNKLRYIILHNQTNPVSCLVGCALNLVMCWSLWLQFLNDKWVQYMVELLTLLICEVYVCICTMMQLDLSHPQIQGRSTLADLCEVKYELYSIFRLQL